MFSKEDSWMGQFVATAKLRRRSDEVIIVVSSVYWPAATALDETLWGELPKIVARS